MPISFVLVVLTITMIPNQVKSSPMLSVQQSGGLCSLDLDLFTLVNDETGVAEYKYVINSTETDGTEIAYAPVENAAMTHSTKISCAEIQINSYGVDSERNDVTQASDTKILRTGPFVDYTLVANDITQKTVSLRFTLNQGRADKYGVTLFQGCHNQFNHDDVFSESVNHFDFGFQCGDLIQSDTEYTVSVVFFCPTNISDCQVKINDVLTVRTLPEPATGATEPLTPSPQPTTPEPEPTTPEPKPDPPTTTPEQESTTSEPESTTSVPETELPTPTLEPTTPEPKPKTPESESTTPEPKPTTPESESTTSEHESTTSVPETELPTPTPELPTPTPEPTTPEPEPTTPEPEPTTPEPEPTRPKSESTTSEPEPTTPEPEPTTPEPEPTTPKSDSTTSEPESTTLEPESTTSVSEIEPPTPTTPELEPTTSEPLPTTPEPEPKPKPTTAMPPPESEKQEKTRRCTKHVFPLWAVCFASVQAAIIVILSIVFAILFKLEYWKPESDDANLIERDMIDNERPSTSSSSGYWSNKRLDPVIVTNESETKNCTNRLGESRLKAGLPSTARPSTRPTSRSLSTRGSSSSILSDVNSTKTSALGGTRSTSNNSQIKITQDLEKPSDTVKKVGSPESEEIDETKVTNMRGVRMGLKSDTKTESYTRPNSIWNQVKISKHDPVKENYSGVRSRFMEGLHKKHAYYLSRKSQKPPVGQRRF